ncbi:hypothetical protein B0H14DRAFT_2572135 [Mycena olivaceomarginata]|nr:hypothetical protein B0H14DRAFT_2572135 [Mycena olivaceomarginata]
MSHLALGLVTFKKEMSPVDGTSVPLLLAESHLGGLRSNGTRLPLPIIQHCGGLSVGKMKHLPVLGASGKKLFCAPGEQAIQYRRCADGTDSRDANYGEACFPIYWYWGSEMQM